MTPEGSGLINFFQQYNSLIKVAAAVTMTGFTAFCDFVHPSVKWVCVLMAVDFILGMAHAWKEDKFTFQGVQKGIKKFVFYALALMVVRMADEVVQIEHVGITLVGTFCAFLAICDASSALVHIAAFCPGVVPPWLLQRFETYRKSYEGTGPEKDTKKP